MERKSKLEDSVLIEDDVSRIIDRTERELEEEEFREIEEDYFEREDKYLRQLLSSPPLSRSEQIRYIRIIRKTGNAKKREIFLNSNLRLVAKIAFKFRRRFSRNVRNNLGVLELIDVGVEGLINALEWFNPDKGNAFSTYATCCIRKTIRDFLAGEIREIRVPDYFVMEDVERVRKFVSGFFRREGREPTFEEISSKTGLSLKKAMEAYECSQIPARYESGRDFSILKKDPYSNPRRKEYLREFEETKEELMDVLKVLDVREKDVLCKRFGIKEPGSMTLEEIGKFYHVTKERIRQIQESAMRKLGEGETGYKLSGLLRDFYRIREKI